MLNNTKTLRLSILFIIFMSCCNVQTSNKISENNNIDQIMEKEHSYEEEWASYFSNVDGVYSSIAVDLGFSKIAPIQQQSNFLWIIIKMNNPRSDGLSSSEESNLLWDIEDKLLESLKKKYNISYVGRLTSDGNRTLYFYIGETLLFEKFISETMVSFPTYQYEYGFDSDPKWEGYFEFLYPEPEQYQSIMNQRVVENLESHGDKLTKLRLVNHWLYFKSEIDRNNFLEKTQKIGFKKEEQGYDESWGEYSYRLRISRIDKVDYLSVDEYVIHLWKLVKEFNGEYDGWETSVEKE